MNRVKRCNDSVTNNCISVYTYVNTRNRIIMKTYRRLIEYIRFGIKLEKYEK